MNTGLIFKSNKGNVLFLILITVALFAALTYAVSSSFRGGTGTISKEQARVSAGEILRYMQSIKQGYEYLWTQQGCSIDEISFIKSGITYGTADFDAATPRSDESCDIFHPLGGGIAYQNLDRYQTDQNVGFEGKFFIWFHGYEPGGAVPYGVVDIGTSDNDPIININWVNEEICNQYNKLLNLDFSSLPSDSGPQKGDADIALEGVSTACIANSATNNQIYFVVQEL